MTEIVLAIIGSGALSAIVSGIFTLVCSKRRRTSGLEAGIRVLLYAQIKHLGNKYIKRGWTNTEELEDLISMHQVYHDELNGNGYLDAIMKAVKQLPIREINA